VRLSLSGSSPLGAWLVLVLAAAPLLPACARAPRGELQTPEAPKSIPDLDRFALALNQFALLPEEHPSRPEYRRVLLDFLVRYIDKTLKERRPGEAFEALQFAGALWRPSELRGARQIEPALCAAAHRIYVTAARRGNERPALFAAAIEQQFGDDAVRERAIANWTEIESWLIRNSPFADEPVLRHEELEESLEEIAANFPAPFVVQRLTDLYVARYEAAIEVAGSSENLDLGLAARHRAEVTGYLMTRLYLRADDFDGAGEALARVELDMPTRKLMEYLDGARNATKSARPLLELARQFLPDDADMPDNISPTFLTQGWGIVENLSRRAVQRFPDDPFAHLLLARALRKSGLVDAAIWHLRRTVALKEDIFDAWQDLASMQQTSLERIAAVDLDAALARMPELEKFHARAVELWRDRPIRPGLPEAQYTLAEALYEQGSVDRAKDLLQRSVRSEPQPAALDLLGTIELKDGKLAEARRHYETLLGLPFDNQLLRLRWETRGRAQLAAILRREGKAAEATAEMQTALRQLNKLIAFPSIPSGERASRLIDRGKLLFHLGDVEQALADFRQARNIANGRAEAYAEPMIFLVSHGYYDEALAIFRAAAPREDLRGSLKLYFALWLHEMALRQERPQDPGVLAFLTDYRGERWPTRLAEHAQGKLSFDDLLRGASDSGERAEAYFYEALRRWRTGNPAGAKELMRKVLGTRRMAFFEYDMAQSYLEWDDLPAKARAPR
jgi:tetratricopeptide (TPR) repeat protein